MIAALTALVIGPLPQVDFDIDDDGYVTSANPIFPPLGEIILGFIATGLVTALLVKFAGPAIKRYYAGRTERIQRELDQAAEARAAAEVEAAEIRTSLGDIEAERARLVAEAAAQAEALLTDGRSQLQVEIADLEARADAEIATIASRSGDELRGEIMRHASRAIDRVVAESLDGALQQQLVEDFISRVGAGAAPATTNGAGS